MTAPAPSPLGGCPSRTPSTCCGRPWWARGRSARPGWPGTCGRRCARRRRRRPGPIPTPATRQRCWRARGRCCVTAGFPAGSGTSPRAWPRRPGRTRSARNWSSSPCRGCRTSTRAANWPGSRWSTRTTGGRWTSRATGGCWPRRAPARRAGRRRAATPRTGSTRRSCW